MKEYTFEDYRNIVEKHLMDFIPDVDHKSITLYESMKYSLSAGGKRIRPVLLLATCDFCGGSIEEALPYACALEYIHNINWNWLNALPGKRGSGHRMRSAREPDAAAWWQDRWRTWKQRTRTALRR